MIPEVLVIHMGECSTSKDAVQELSDGFAHTWVPIE